MLVHARKDPDWNVWTVHMRMCEVCMSYAFSKFLDIYARLPRYRFEGTILRRCVESFELLAPAEKAIWLFDPRRVVLSELLPDYYDCSYYETHPDLSSALRTHGFPCEP